MLTINAIIHGVVKVSCFSSFIIHCEFINSLPPLESGFICSIRDAGSHGSMLLGSNYTSEAYSEPCQISKMKFFAKIVND